MKFLGILKSVVQIVPAIIDLFKKDDPADGTAKVGVEDLVEFGVSNLFPALRKAVDYGKLDTKEKIDAWLETYDQSTGSDEGAVHLVAFLPPEKEEEMGDHLKEAARIFAYGLAKVPGFHV